MALVSYDVSDASGSEDDETDQIVNNSQVKKAATVKSEISSLDESAGPSRNDPISDDEDIGDETKNEIFSGVPRPKSTSAILDSDSLKKLLLNKPNQSTDDKPVRKAVKIAVPALSEFEDDLPRPLATKPVTSGKGSGLFSLLPPPKYSGLAATVKLVPDSLKKSTVPKPVVKPPVRLPPPVPVVPAPTDDDDDDDDSSGDFFSLNKSQEPEAIIDLPIEEPTVPADPTPVVGPVPREPELVFEPTDYIPLPSDSLELDEEAMQRLCGGNKRKRDTFQAELIDVSEKDVVPDKNEWLRKALTEQKRTRSHKKGLGPSTAQRRKHQITYLAYQAKEQEEDLQNQWATNKMTKKQTQSKYGF